MLSLLRGADDDPNRFRNYESLVMMVVAMIVAAEKLLRQPAVVARIVGLFAIVAGVASFVVSLRTS